MLHDTTPADPKRWPKEKPHRANTVGFGVSNLQASTGLAWGLESVTRSDAGTLGVCDIFVFVVDLFSMQAGALAERVGS